MWIKIKFDNIYHVFETKYCFHCHNSQACKYFSFGKYFDYFKYSFTYLSERQNDRKRETQTQIRGKRQKEIERGRGFIHSFIPQCLQRPQVNEREDIRSQNAIWSPTGKDPGLGASFVVFPDALLDTWSRSRVAGTTTRQVNMGGMCPMNLFVQIHHEAFATVSISYGAN